MMDQKFPFRLFRRYRRDESGAITVDWVVLTAVVVAMVMSLFTILTETIFEDTATAIAEDITNAGTGNF